MSHKLVAVQWSLWFLTVQLCCSPHLASSDDTVEPVLSNSFSNFYQVLENNCITCYREAHLESFIDRSTSHHRWESLPNCFFAGTGEGCLEHREPFLPLQTSRGREVAPQQPPVCGVCSPLGMYLGPDFCQCWESPCSRMSRSPGASQSNPAAAKHGHCSFSWWLKTL